MFGLILTFVGCLPDPIGDEKPAADDSGLPGDTSIDSGDTASADLVLADLREALVEDAAGAMADYAATYGWPVRVAGGYLFVTTDSGDWNLTGDFDDWGAEPMARDDGFSWIVQEIDGPSGYKFTDGSTWNPDPWSRQYTYDEYGEMSLVGTTEAHLERLFDVGDANMAPRTVRAWVPAETPTHVLYVADGQNLFDPEAFWGGWHLQDSVPDAMLLVGIDNTADRMDEYTHVPDVIDGETMGGDGDAYAAFVQDTVRPLVNDVWGEPATVGLMGSSLGGLISFHIADRYPGEYRFAASLSGTMGWGSIGANNETMIERYAGAGHRDTALYLDSGGNATTCADSDGDGIDDDDLESDDNYCENLQLRDALEAEGYEFDVDLWHWWEPDAEHNEAAWADRVYRPLEIFAEL